MNTHITGVFKIFCAVSLLMACTACAPQDEQPKEPSKDATELANIINLPFPIDSVTWERFEFPEKTDSWVANNYEQTVLIAEIDSDDQRWLTNNQEVEMNYPVHNALRPWLSESSRRILSNTPVSQPANKCKYLATTVRSGREVEGYVCPSGEKILLYMVLGEQS